MRSSYGPGGGAGGDDGDDRPPYRNFNHPDLLTARQLRKNTNLDDEEPPPPNFFHEPFDWIFSYYHSTALWQIPVIFFFIVWLLIA